MKSRALLVVPFVLAIAGVASATLRREGSWPDDPRVSVDVSNASRGDALRKIADAAGWSLVVQAPPGEPIDLHVKDQPASKVLEILLGDGDYVASRDGSLVSIQRASAPPSVAVPSAPPAPPSPPPPPTATARGENRVVTGGSLKIEKDEVVHDVTVFGGSLHVYGTVTGSVAVMGGSVHVHEGGHVLGDATTFGGSLTLDDGARIDGDVGTFGGSLHRAEGAKVGGALAAGSKKSHGPRVTITDDDDEPRATSATSGNVGSFVSRAASRVSRAVTMASLFFVFGSVLLALLTSRMDRLQGEIAARPMRSFALGIVGLLVSGIAIVAMVVSFVGIPFAIVAALALALATYGGMCAVLTTGGRALAGHRTDNPYVHLAIGCAVFLALAAIPGVGGLFVSVVTLVGVGAVFATRGAGVFAKRREGAEPYRAG